jgi:inosine-uridine nucleoside N-ribohydrolase
MALALEPHPVTLVPTGPLTNVALFLARYPQLAEKLERIVLMGGAIGEGNMTPAAEFNVWADPEAAQRVFSSGVDLTMVGLEVTQRALLTDAHAERLREAGRAGRLVAELYDFYSRYHRGRHESEGAPMHDALAVAHVIDPGLLRTASCGVIVDTGPELSRGRTYVDRSGSAGWPANCQVAVDVDVQRFLELLLERIARLG